VSEQTNTINNRAKQMEDIINRRYEKENNEIQEQDMNSFFRVLKGYMKGKKEEWIPCKRILKIDKKEIIIFEADFKKIDFSILQNETLPHPKG